MVGVWLLSPLGALLASALAMPSVHQEHARRPPMVERGVHRPAPPDTPSPERWVYGYYAYWAGELSDVDWARLSHVAVFAVDMNADGSFSGGSRWTELGPEAVALGAPHGTRVHLTLTCFDDDVMTSVLTNTDRRAALVENLGAAVDAAGAHGVSVDCEGVPGELRDPMTAFVVELKARVDEVTIATPAVDWSDAFDKAALSQHADAIFIMGYDYHWSGGNPGPVAPLAGGGPWSRWSLSDTVQTYLDEGADPERLILGLPLYGRTWPTTDNSIPGTATGSGSTVTLVQGVALAETHGRLYDTVSDTSYIFITSTSQTWYDDPESLQVKIHWAIEQGLGGIGFWALNYEGGDADFWQMVTDETTGLDPGEPVDTGGGSGSGSGSDAGSGSGSGSGMGSGSGATGGSDSGASVDSAAPGEVAEPRGLNFSAERVGCGAAGLLPLGWLGLAVARRRRRG